MKTKYLYDVFFKRIVQVFLISLLIISPSIIWGQYVTFSDESQSAGVAEPDSGTGHGVTFADFNGDGLLDIYMVNWGNQPNFLFINNGDGTFTNRAEAYGVTVPLGSDRGVSAADFDNDGDMDFYVSSGGHNYFFRNDNNQRFTNITYSANVSDGGEGMNVCFGDYDNDGDLDLLITNQDYGENQLFHNNGDGTFSKVTEQAGLGNHKYSNGAAFFDYDNDGYPDIFIARGTRDKNYSGLLYHNNGNGTFTELAASAGAGVPGNELGVAIGDYNNDGYLDIYVTEVWQPNRLYRNNGDGTFTDVAAQAGVADAGRNVGCTFGDFNNDGYLDIYETTYGGYNRLYRNNGDGSFSKVGGFAGVNHWGNGFGLTLGDYNRDGQVDIFLSNAGQRAVLFKNNGSGHGWLALKLTGQQSNRSAIGARIKAVAGGKTQIREICGGSSYVSENSLEVYFGFGNADSIDSLVIHWPSGIVQKFMHLQLNQYLSITETQTPSEPQLSVDPERLNLGYSGVQASFQIHNSGGGQLNWQIEGNWNAPWISGISPLSGTNDGQVTVQIDRTDLTAGIYRKTLHITSNGGEDSLKIIVKVSSPENFNLRMVAGGQDYIDRAGELWRADQPYTPGDWGYVGGKVNVEKDSIKNTTDPYLYQTERYGLNAYKFDVPDGRYTVILHFAEIYWHQSGKRIFNVSVEDSLVLDHYDIFAEVGADYATIHAYTAKVSDGLLTIDFKTIQDNSEITAIEIIGLSTPNFPVELTSLNAALMGANQIRLEWSTKTETNNLGFEIERKYENKDFKKIGFVNGNGTSNNPQYYEFRDRVDEMGDYTYRLKQIDLNGLFKYSSEARVTVAAPPNIIVLQNYPNPFNNSTLIQYSVPEKFSGQTVKLTIYDITGDIVKETTRNKTKAGEYDFRWDGTDENDHPVASGLFFYRLKVGPIEKFSRMILLK